MTTSTDLDHDLSVLRGQMLDLLRQINALPGKKNQRRRKELWQRFQVYATEAKALDAQRVDHRIADI